MTHPRTQILVWLHRATKNNDRAADGIAGATWSYRRRVEEQQKNGFRYRPVDWFGSLPPAETKRLQRAAVALEKDGLLERIAAWGDRVTHLKLTDKGRVEAERLAKVTDVRIIDEHGYWTKTIAAADDATA